MKEKSLRLEAEFHPCIFIWNLNESKYKSRSKFKCMVATETYGNSKLSVFREKENTTKRSPSPSGN